MEDATAAVLAAQAEVGIDIGNDGEQARESFFTYVQHRMTGFGATSRRPLMADLAEHPDYVELALPRFERTKVSLMTAPAAIGEVTYRDTAELDAELALVTDTPFAETFMTAASPGIVASAMENRHYDSRAAYVHTVAAALRTEYRAIVDRNLLLQIDAPDLALNGTRCSRIVRWTSSSSGSSSSSTPSTSRSRTSIPRPCDCTCAGATTKGPTRTTSTSPPSSPGCTGPFGALVISMANARHAHEYRCFERDPLPDGMVLVAGVIDTTSNYVEHPEVVADRLIRVAEAVGDPRRIIAGTDCQGFDAFGRYR